MNKVILMALLMPAMALGQTGNDYGTHYPVNMSQSHGGQPDTAGYLAVNGSFAMHSTCENPAPRPGITGFEFEAAQIMVNRGDVIITEIMADPVPAVSLPEEEYIEIMNRTLFDIPLTGWTLRTDNQSCSFPDMTILKGEYLIVCSIQDTSYFTGFGRVAGVKSFPALTDAGRLLYICDGTGKMIHGVEYSSGWYMNELKEEGGWSLEIADTDYPFNLSGNWKPSVADPGGTPGAPNSVLCPVADDFFEGIVNVYPADSLSLIIRFSETVMNPDVIGENITVDNNTIVNALPVSPLLDLFELKLSVPLEQRSIYRISASAAICDFAGNIMQRPLFDTGVPERAEKGDILFNEILFNPLPGDPDYIELFNCSEKIVDASRLLIASINDATGDTSSSAGLYNEHFPVLPGKYYAATTEKEKVVARYTSSDPEMIHHVSSMPSMPDDKGHIILLNRELRLIDEVIYNDKMHFPLLAGNEGIALEKVQPGVSASGGHVWYSASEDSGWGTPGAPNSVYSGEMVKNDVVELSSGRITPDNNGIEDMVEVNLKLTGEGNVVSVIVFDETGAFIRNIAVNLYSGPAVSLYWDGTAEDGTLVSTGIYIIFITVFDDGGKTVRWKKVCTVIR